MSDEKRDPLLSDELMQFGPNLGRPMSPESVRAFYEDLVITDKLLPVVEVTLIEHQETENGKLERCSRCEAVINPLDKWCSGCAGKIKR